MDITALINAVSNIGFPMALVFYLLYRDEKQEERHREETEKFTTAINNNTNALIELREAMKR